MERERSPCQMLMTCSLQCEWEEDWLGAWGRREAWTALSRDEFLEAQVEGKKKEKEKSLIPTERIQESYLFQDQFLLRTKIVSWRVSGHQNGDQNPWAVLYKAGLIAPAQEWLWCIARPLYWHFSSVVQRLRSCKAVSVELDFLPLLTPIHLLPRVVSSSIQRSITASNFQSPVKCFIEDLHKVKMISRPCAAQRQRVQSI